MTKGKTAKLAVHVYKRDAMHSAVLVIVNLSVCPSVCLSVTLVDCVLMVWPIYTIMVSSPYRSVMILVFRGVRSFRNSKGVTPSESVE